MELSHIALLLLPLGINFAFIRLSFMSWYERELKLRNVLLQGFGLAFLMTIIMGLIIYTNLISEELSFIYQQIIISAFFLGIAQLVFSLFWIRKGVHTAFLVVTVASYISILWLLFPLIYINILPLNELQILLASYFSGAIIGTILPIAIVEEIRPKEGITTISVATTALSAADAVSKVLIHQSVFPSFIIQIVIFAVSFILSGFFYSRLTK